MRFRQIEVFHAIYTNGSISAAARALNNLATVCNAAARADAEAAVAAFFADQLKPR